MAYRQQPNSFPFFPIVLPRIYLLERRIFGVCDVFCKVAALELLCSSLSLKDIEFQAQLKTPNTLWQTVKKSGEDRGGGEGGRGALEKTSARRIGIDDPIAK